MLADLEHRNDEETVLGTGFFRKKAKVLRNWKGRKYIVTSDGVLSYYDPTSGYVQGFFSLASVRLAQAPAKLVHDAFHDRDGKNSLEYMGAVPISVQNLTGASIVDLVFDTAEAAGLFIGIVDRCCKLQRTQVCL